MSDALVYLIDTVPDCVWAVQQLMCQTEIALDVEGVNLSRSGQISLVQIATAGAVYLFDITQLKRSAFKPGRSEGLTALLENDAILKVIFDCRTDSDALFHQYDVTMKNTLDLQVFHAFREFKFNCDESTYLTGLQKCLTLAAPHISGMDVRLISTIKTNGRRLFQSSYKIWDSRPLPQELLTYAANDVKYLLPMKDLWACNASGFQLIPMVKQVTRERINEAISRVSLSAGRHSHMAHRDFELPSGFEAGPTTESDPDFDLKCYALSPIDREVCWDNFDLGQEDEETDEHDCMTELLIDQFNRVLEAGAATAAAPNLDSSGQSQLGTWSTWDPQEHPHWFGNEDLVTRENCEHFGMNDYLFDKYGQSMGLDHWWDDVDTGSDYGESDGTVD